MSRKKANGEGSISKRSDGRYMARYTVNGKRKYIYGATHGEVREKLNEKLNEIAKGEYIEPNKETVEKWLKDWLVTYALPTVKQSTYISYESYIRLHICPQLGNVALTALTIERLQLFFNRLSIDTNQRKSLSPKSIRNIYNMFHEALDQAVINRKIIRNPLIGIKLPKIVKQEIRILSLDEQAKLQSAAFDAPEPQAYGIVFALNTGIRLGELLSLQWKDIDFLRHTVRIRRTSSRLAKVDKDGNVARKSDECNSTEIVIRSPKSITSRREIPIFDELWEGLMIYRQQQKEMMEALQGTYVDNDFIFANTSGCVYDPRVYEDLFTRCLKSAGLQTINFHALRHTFATRALERGMDIKTLSSILGHTQASTTLNLYGHALPDHKRISMDKMRGVYLEMKIDTNKLSPSEAQNAI